MEDRLRRRSDWMPEKRGIAERVAVAARTGEVRRVRVAVEGFKRPTSSVWIWADSVLVW